MDWTGLDRSIFCFSGIKIGLKILIQPGDWKWSRKRNLELLVMKHIIPIVLKADMHIPHFHTLLSL